jgi:hypothetical protein
VDTGLFYIARLIWESVLEPETACEPRDERNTIAYEGFGHYVDIECALKEIVLSEGDSIAVADVMEAIDWSPKSWNLFTSRIRNDLNFKAGLADAGFIDEHQGEGRFIRVAPANDQALQRLKTLETLYGSIVSQVVSSQPRFSEERHPHRYLGYAEVGTWRTAGAIQPLPPEYEDCPSGMSSVRNGHTAVIVLGDNMAGAGFLDGMLVTAHPNENELSGDELLGGGPLGEGRVVLVRRSRSDLVELSVRQIRYAGSKMTLVSVPLAGPPDIVDMEKDAVTIVGVDLMIWDGSPLAG